MIMMLQYMLEYIWLKLRYMFYPKLMLVLLLIYGIFPPLILRMDLKLNQRSNICIHDDGK